MISFLPADCGLCAFFFSLYCCWSGWWRTVVKLGQIKYGDTIYLNCTTLSRPTTSLLLISNLLPIRRVYIVNYSCGRINWIWPRRNCSGGTRKCVNRERFLNRSPFNSILWQRATQSVEVTDISFPQKRTSALFKWGI